MKSNLKKIRKEEVRDIDYSPRSKAQKLLMQRDFEGVSEVCLFGASGVGKTAALVISSMGPQKDGSMLVDRPEYRCLFLRREYTMLTRSGLIDAALFWYRRFYPKVEFNKVEKIFTFPSGAKIFFGGCEQDSDREKYKGYTELHAVFYEELTQFSQPIFDFINSRLRTSTNIPLRIRSSTNSGDREESWVLERYKYWITKCVVTLDKPIEAQSGEVLYYWAEGDNHLVSKNKPDNCISYSFCGIETFINDIKPDNESFMSARLTDPVDKAQLVDGIWGLKKGSGMYFTKDWLKESYSPSKLSTKIRYWDKACSGKSGDFLCGALVSRDLNDFYIIEDIILLKVEVSEVMSTIKDIAKKDGTNVYIGIEQEGGSSGKEISHRYKSELQALGYSVVIDVKTVDRSSSSKIQRAALISAPMKEGKISFIRNNYSDEMLFQLTSFPGGKHDDAVDAISGAHYLLNRLPLPAKPVTSFHFTQNEIDRMMGVVMV